MRSGWEIVAVACLLAGCGGGGTSPSVPGTPGGNGGGSTAAYTVTDLGANFEPRHINAAGTIVGDVRAANGTDTTAALWQSGALKTLTALPGYPDSQANWINTGGEIVGSSSNYVTLDARATQFSATGAAADLGVPATYYSSGAYSVNDNGYVVGAAYPQYTTGTTYGFPASFGSAGPAILDSGHTNGEAYAVNNNGKIVGASCCVYGFPDTSTQAFTYPPMTALTMPADAGEGAVATDVNANGDVIGYYSLGPDNRSNATCCGFYLHNGTLTEIDDPSRGSGHGFVWALAINDAGAIVGAYGTPNMRAFVYTGTVVDLNTLIPAGTNWVLQQATSVNASGQIVGTGTLNGAAHGFLLTPH